MMLKTACSALLALSLISGATTASAQITDITDIQVYDATGTNASPFNGATVTIRGVVTVVKGTYNFGTHYVQDATGGIQLFDGSAPALAIGDEVEVTGPVTSFGGEIQLGTSSWTYLSSPGDPTPEVIAIDDFFDYDMDNVASSGDYEHVGKLVSVTGFVIGAGTFTAGSSFSFSLANSPTDTAGVFVFLDSDTGVDASSVANGDLFQITSPVTLFSAVPQLKPRIQGDLVENPGNPFPLVENITPSPWCADAGEAVNLSMNISDNGTITAATLYYRYGSFGAFTSTPLVNGGGSSYSATLPGGPAGVLDYYIEASDETAQITLVPGDAPASARRLPIGLTSLYDIQANMLVGSDASAYSDSVVCVEGIITVAPGELSSTGSLSSYVIADAAGGEWSAVLVFEGSGANVLFQGDKVRIAGRVDEFSGTTEILPLRSDAVELISFGEPLPPIVPIGSTMADTTEAWESVIVQVHSSTVADTSAGGERWELLGTGEDSLIFVNPAPGASYIANLGERLRVSGWLDTRFGTKDNTLIPLNNGMIEMIATGVPELDIAEAAVFSGAYPNPFNPSTNLKFSVPARGMVELAIYNARGERVRTLINGEMEAAEHTTAWDGMDHNGEFVGSGVYYARLRYGSISVDLEKLTLVK